MPAAVLQLFAADNLYHMLSYAMSWPLERADHRSETDQKRWAQRELAGLQAGLLGHQRQNVVCQIICAPPHGVLNQWARMRLAAVQLQCHLHTNMTS